jgi:hypothetical protein
MNLKHCNKHFSIGFNSRYFMLNYTKLRHITQKVYGYQFELGWFYLIIKVKGN